MRTGRQHPQPQAGAFTLLEMIVVLAITAMVISAVYTVAQGTLILADDVHRAELRDTRKQAFTTFCERLFSALPPDAALNLKTTQSGGEYLTQLQLDNVSSPFDGMPNCTVKLYTESLPGGGMRLMLSCQPVSNPNDPTQDTSKGRVSVVLFDDLLKCEWRVYVPATQQWATIWTEETDTAAAPAMHQHPPLLDLSMNQGGEESPQQVFWIAPALPLTLAQGMAPPVPGNIPQPNIQVPQQPAQVPPLQPAR